MKTRTLKNWVSYTLFSINVILILLDIMLLAELNECYLFYSISINIVILNTYIIHKASKQTFINKYMNIFTDEERNDAE